MPEEQFIQMYVRDFATMASRVEAGSDIEAQLSKRITETRSHAALMDARKAEGHLAAVIERLRSEARKDASQAVKNTPDPVAAAARRQEFMLRVADMLDSEMAEPEKRGAARF